MPGNTWGKLFRITTFGESHGPAIGGVIDGMPPNISIDTGEVQHQLNRRRPGQSLYVTPRSEKDEIEFLSGLFEGKTTGAPIAFLIRNQDSKSSDYDHLKDVFRPSHADYTYQLKYGIRDHRGGGRASARETAVRVAGGSLARQMLRDSGLQVVAFTSGIGLVSSDFNPDIAFIESNPLRCPDPSTYAKMEAYLDALKASGDTCGSAVSCFIRNVPAGLGEPVFDKFQADLGKAMLSINGCNGFEIGSGFRGTRMKGSEHNDVFVPSETDDSTGVTRINTLTNNAGGVQGGITNGEVIQIRISFKPVPTLGKSQQTVNTSGDVVNIQGKGRHDLCIAPRAVPVVEAMAWLTLADHYLRLKTYR